MASSKSEHQLNITTKVKDLASDTLRSLGKTGKVSAASIATGFIAAKVAIAAFSAAARTAVDAVKSITVGVAEQGDTFAKMSKRLGVAVETLSAYKHIAELSGASFESVANGFKFLAKNANDAGDGVGEAKTAFEELGIAVVGSDGKLRDLEDLFSETAGKLGALDNATKRAALAQRIFGRSALDLIPIFLEGEDGIRRLRYEVEKTGNVWTKEGAESAEKFNDAMKNMGDSIEGIKVAIGTQLLPVLTDAFTRITGTIVENREEIADWATGLISDALPKIESFATGAVREFKKIEGGLRLVMSAAGKVAGWFGTLNDLLNPDQAFNVVPMNVDVANDIRARAKQGRTEGQLSGLRSNIPFHKLASGFLNSELQATQFPVNPGPFTEHDFALSQGGFNATEPYGPNQMPQFSASLEEIMQGPASLPNTREEFTKLAAEMREFNAQTKESDSSLMDLSAGGLSTISSGFSSFFSAMIRGTADTATAFRSMVTDILASMAQLAANQVFSQILNSVLGSVATGGATPAPTSQMTVAGSFASGGQIPGPIGAAQLAVVHGGEYVLSRDDLRNGAGGGQVVVNQVIQPSPGMDERMLGEYAAGAVSRAMRENRGFRRQLRGTARGGLY